VEENMSDRVQPRRRKPRWGVIAIFLGVALAAFLFGIIQFLQPEIMRTRYADGIVAFDEWRFPLDIELEGEPQLTELDDGSVQVSGVFSGSRPIDPIDLELTCETLDTPPTWNLAECAVLPDRPNAFSIVIQR
jgi:hypothetical protein